MSFNYGMSPYGMSPYGMMGMMDMTGGMYGNVSTMQTLKAKYACDDCYKKHPYWVECATPVMPVPYEVVNPGILPRVQRLFFG